MRIGIKIDSAETPELRALLAHLANCDGEATVRLNGPVMWAAETEMLSYSPMNAAHFLRGLADRIEKNAHIAAGEEPREIVPLIKEVDPELERLIAEEEEIERQTRSRHQ